jgi:hypothetical protein
MIDIRGIEGFHPPLQRDKIEVGIRIGSGSGVEKEVVSVDRVTDLPVQNSLEPSVHDEMLIPETLIIALIVSSIARDIIRSITVLPGLTF